MVSFTTKAGLDARLALEPANRAEAQILSDSLKRDIKNLTHATDPKVFPTLNLSTQKWLREDTPLRRTIEKTTKLVQKFDLGRTIRRMLLSIAAALSLGLAVKTVFTPEGEALMRKMGDAYCNAEDEILTGAARAYAYAAETASSASEFMSEQTCEFSSEAISAFERAKAYTAQIGNSAIEQTAYYAKTAQEFVEDQYCHLSSEMAESLERINGYISQTANTIYETTSAAWEATGGAFVKASNAFGEGLSTAWNQGSEAVSNLAKTVEQACSSLYQTVRGFAGESGETATNALATLKETSSILSLTNIGLGVAIGLGAATVGYVASRHLKK